MAQYANSTCEICIGGPGEHFCRQCDQIFCRTCKLSHLRTQISKNHTFVSGTNIIKEEKPLCTEHKESFLFYCDECDTPACRICSVEKHSRHLMVDLTKSTEKLRSDLSKSIESKITTSKSNISKIEVETKIYREEVKTVIKTITDEGNYWKQFIDKKVEALIKLVQDKEHKEIQNMSAYSEVYERVVANCQTWQKNIKKMETTTDVLLLKKLKQLKTDVEQTVLKQIPDAPDVSYRNKKPSCIEIDSLFGELKFRDSKEIIGQTDNQHSAKDSKDIIGHTDNFVFFMDSKEIIGQTDNQQSANLNVKSSILDGRMREEPHHYVAAIDIGTTYSGYAFSARVEPLSIYTCEWQDIALTSSKTPTSVLLNKRKEFVAFGYHADIKYTQSIIPDEEMEDFYYFRRFKMRLHNERLTTDTEIQEEGGKKMKALDVFCIAIKYLKDHLIRKIQSRVMGVKEDDVLFVLTIPAIWFDETNIFMRKAAEKAGLKKDQLTLALEPEAAYLYCHELRPEVDVKENKFLQTIKSGMKFMVIDLGGCTADITVHQRQRDETLEDVIPPSCGPWGGTAVDQAFLDLMKSSFGEDVIDGLKEEDLEDYFELLREFEIKKKSVKSKGDDDRDIVMRMSVTLMDLIKTLRGDISSHIKTTKYKDFVSVEGQKLHIKADFFRDLFKSTIDKLIQHLRKIFEKPELYDLKNVFMVGGFSECELVQMAVRNRFGSDRKIIIPNESGLAVLKGAVLFGYRYKKINKRILTKTYGIQGWSEWDPDIHPATKKIRIGGTDRCEDIFFKFATVNDQLEDGHTSSVIFQALNPNQRTLECAIYTSTDPNPKYVTDPTCQRLRNLIVDLPNRQEGELLEIEVSFVFGGLEVLFRAKDLKTGRIFEPQLDFS